MKKDILITVGIWIVSTVAVAVAAAMAWNYILLKSSKADLSKYVTKAEALENIDMYDGIDGGVQKSGIMALRRVMSDSVIEEDGISLEYSYIFTSSHGDFALSEGIFGAIVSRDDSGKFNTIKNISALYGIKDIYGTEVGEEIYRYITENENGGIKVDKYAVKSGYAYLMEISFTDENDSVVSAMSCDVNADITDYEICEAEDEWIYHQEMKTILGLKEAYETAGKELKATEYAKSLKNSVKYSTFKTEEHFKPAIHGGVYSVVSTADQYAFIEVMVINTGKGAYLPMEIAAGAWSVLVIAIGAVVICVRNARRKRNQE